MIIDRTQRSLQKLIDLCFDCLPKKCKNCIFGQRVNFGKEILRNDQKSIDYEKYLGWYAGNSAPWFPLGTGVEVKRFTEGKHPQIIKDIVGQGKVLDIGCGEGWLVGFLRDIGVEAYGVDYNPNAISNAYENAKPYLSVASSDNLKMFDDNSFDFVIAREVFEHLTFNQAITSYSEMRRISKKYIYLTIWLNFFPGARYEIIYQDLRDDTHITFCTRKFWKDHLLQFGDEEDSVLEEKLDWANKGRCFVFRKQPKTYDILK